MRLLSTLLITLLITLGANAISLDKMYPVEGQNFNHDFNSVFAFSTDRNFYSLQSYVNNTADPTFASYNTRLLTLEAGIFTGITNTGSGITNTVSGVGLTALTNTLLASGTGGTGASFSTTGAGTNKGVLNNTTSSNGSVYGLTNTAYGNNTGLNYGLFNKLTGEAGATLYGIYSQVSGGTDNYGYYGQSGTIYNATTIESGTILKGSSVLTTTITATGAATFNGTNNTAKGVYTSYADVPSDPYNTFYDAITLDSVTGNKAASWLVTAKINNDGITGYYAVGIVNVSHSGGVYGNEYIALASNNITLAVKSASANPCVIQVKETASGVATNIRVSALRITPLGTP